MDRRVLTVLFLIGVIAGSLSYFLVVDNESTAPGSTKIIRYKTMVDCRKAPTHSAVATCVKDLSPIILKKEGIQGLADELDVAAQYGRVMKSCHLALHPVGEKIGAEAARQNKPKPKFVRALTVCSQGINHGIIESFLANASQAQLQAFSVLTSCPTTYNEKKQPVYASCVHGFGHAAYRALQDRNQSFDLCQNMAREIQDSKERLQAIASCTHGIFMRYSIDHDNQPSGCNFEGVDPFFHVVCLGYLRTQEWYKDDKIRDAQSRCIQESKDIGDLPWCTYEVEPVLRQAQQL